MPRSAETEELRALYKVQLSKLQDITDYTHRRTYFVAIKTVEIILKTISKNKIVIADLGCGQGLVEKYIWKILKNKSEIEQKQLTLICLDLNKHVLVREWIGNTCEKIVAFLPFIPLRNKSIDVIIISEVIEHIPSKLIVNLIKGLYDLLVVGGVLILTTPNISNYTSRVRFLFTGKLDLLDDWQHFQYFNYKKLKKMLENTGFKIRRENFDLVMESSGFISRLALLIPLILRRIILKILPELDKLIVIIGYKITYEEEV